MATNPGKPAPNRPNDAVRLLALDRLLLAAAIVLPLVAIAIGVLRSDEPGVLWFAILYVAPMLVAAPFWVRVRTAQHPLSLSAAWILDGLVMFLAALRAVGAPWLPFSGHTLFLTYSGIVTPHRRYRLLALALFLETTVFKLWLWRDPLSWGLGIATGMLLAVAESRVGASR